MREPSAIRTDSPHLAVRPTWLAARQEPAQEPDLSIIDAHHHLWDRVDSRYLMDDYLADIASGHRIEQTVYVQCRSMYRTDGEAAMRPVGEVEFASRVAAQSAAGQYGMTRLCTGIVGCADLRLGQGVARVIDALVEAGGGRLAGIRNATAHHPDSAVRSSPVVPPPGLLEDVDFSAGAGVLAQHGLVLDIWAYHTQLGELYALAHAHPELIVVIDHFGGPLGVGPYRDQTAAVFRDWRRQIVRLATLPNTRLKLGGFGMRVLGQRFYEESLPPSSDALAAAWRPYFDAAIEAFGPTRCLFESNFPVDKGMYGYGVFWNACKKLSSGFSADERAALFSETARQIYRLPDFKSAEIPAARPSHSQQRGVDAR